MCGKERSKKRHCHKKSVIAPHFSIKAFTDYSGVFVGFFCQQWKGQAIFAGKKIKTYKTMKKQSIAILLLAGISLCSSCTEESEYTQGVWQRKSDFDGVARCNASSFTIDNKGYVCCGYRGSNKELLKDLWVYDIEGNYWTQLADMPDAAVARHSAASFALNGKGYITTGALREAPDCLADTWEYDPTSNTWKQMDDYPGGARYGALAFAIDGYGWVGTGYNDNTLKDFYRFDPNAATGSQWQIHNGFPGLKRYYGTAFVINDEAYICCGINNDTNVEDFWKFDGSAWTQLRDIANNSDDDYDDDYNIARRETVSFVIDGKGYIATGYSGGVTSDYWVYDPATDLWSGDSDDDFTPLTEATYGGSSRSAACSFSTGTRGFVLLGQTGGSYLEDVYELLPYEQEDAD